MGKGDMKDKHGDDIEEGHIVTSENHKWIYKILITEDGKLFLRGLNLRHSQYLTDQISGQYEIIGELNERMRDL